jgi:hypothetical protein
MFLGDLSNRLSIRTRFLLNPKKEQIYFAPFGVGYFDARNLEKV